MAGESSSAACGPCRVGDHMGCLADCGCAHCADLRVEVDPVFALEPKRRTFLRGKVVRRGK